MVNGIKKSLLSPWISDWDKSSPKAKLMIAGIM